MFKSERENIKTSDCVCEGGGGYPNLVVHQHFLNGKLF